MTEVPAATTAPHPSKSAPRRPRPSGAVGSSRTSSLGATANALAISSRCFSASVSVSTRSPRWTRSPPRRAAAAPSRPRRPRPRTPRRAGRPGGSRAPSCRAAPQDAGGRWRCRARWPSRDPAPWTSSPCEDDGARVRLRRPGGDVHQRGLAGPVLAEDGVHLTGRDVTPTRPSARRRPRSSWRCSPARASGRRVWRVGLDHGLPFRLSSCGC